MKRTGCFKIVYVLAGIFIFILSGCRDAEKPSVEMFRETKIKETPEMLNFVYADVPVENKLDSIVEVMKYIPLETNEQSLIGYIDEVLFDDDLIFVADYRMSKSVFIFSGEGKYITKIAAYGQSGKEYVSLNSVDLDTEAKLIYLLDGERGKIMAWNYKGEFVENIDLPFQRLNTFRYDRDGIFYFDFGFRDNKYFKGEPYNLVAYDARNESVTASFFPYRKEYFLLGRYEQNHLDKINDRLFYHTLLGNCAYRIDGDSLAIAVKIDFGKDQYPEECYMMSNKELKKKEKEGQYKVLGSYLDFKDWMYFGVDNGSYRTHCFYNKTRNIFYKDLSHLIVKNKFIPPVVYRYDENTLCGWVPAEALHFFKDCDPELMNRVVEDDNPLLVFYRLR